MIGAVWLILAAVPALADGGPHVTAINNGSLGLNADSCAGCHRAHTAQGPFLINAADEKALCLTCHGSAGAGATTDVASGLQYRLTRDSWDGPARGAAEWRLRHGRASTPPTRPRILVSTDLASSDDQWAKVRVLTDGTGAVDPTNVTSAHLNLAANGLAGPTVAWGNGPIAPGRMAPGRSSS